jgi:hypothetical protein
MLDTSHEWKIESKKRNVMIDCDEIVYKCQLCGKRVKLPEDRNIKYSKYKSGCSAKIDFLGMY